MAKNLFFYLIQATNQTINVGLLLDFLFFICFFTVFCLTFLPVCVNIIAMIIGGVSAF